MNSHIVDHRKLGDKYRLFSFFEDKGPGFPVWKDHGLKIRQALIDYWRELHLRSGYKEMESPILLDKSLWEVSGHMNYFKENMYFCEVEKRDYVIKPMSCPAAILVFQEEKRSFKELPLRFCELGHVHRQENSGSLHGLLRVRSFYQDDAHIFCSASDLVQEASQVISLMVEIMQNCGLKDYRFNLSIRGGEKEYLGSDEEWKFAQESLEEALKQKNLKARLNPGEAKFYGPSLDLEIKDAHGRYWQCSSLQLDFNLPERFGLHYFNAEGRKEKPYMLHRAIYGSLERFIGILLEHYGKNLPFWMMPVQIKILSVGDVHEYGLKVLAFFREQKMRVEADFSDESLSSKIKKSKEREMVYAYVVVGAKERDNNQISLNGESLSFEDALKKLI